MGEGFPVITMSVRNVNCSLNTAPSSPERKSSFSNAGEDFYFSEPTSPTHFLTHFLQSSDSESARNLTTSIHPAAVEEYVSAQNPEMCGEMRALNGVGDNVSSSTSFEFEFTSRQSEMAGDQPFAEELFLNGQIRPLNEQTKFQYIVTPIYCGSNIRSVDASAGGDEFHVGHGASKEYTTKINKGRSNSLRNFLWENSVKEDTSHQGMKGTGKMEVEGDRGSKRWRLKDFLDRSGSHRKRGKDMLCRLPSLNIPPAKHGIKTCNIFEDQSKQGRTNKPTACARYDDTKLILGGNRFNKSNGVRVSAYSAHEVKCKENRGRDENRRRSFLSYTRGFLGGLMNGLTRSLHPFSSI